MEWLEAPSPPDTDGTRETPRQAGAAGPLPLVGVRRSHTASAGLASPAVQRHRKGSEQPGAFCGWRIIASPESGQSTRFFVSEVELPSAEEEVALPRLSTVDSVTATVGNPPGQPGKSMSNVVSSLQPSMSPVSGSRGGQAPRVSSSSPTSIVGGASSLPSPPLGRQA